MELLLDLGPALGRPAIDVSAELVRELTADDIARLRHAKHINSLNGTLKRISARHHAAARLLASGRSVKETAMLSGYTPQNITDLLNDPLFMDLTETYRGVVTAEYRGIHAQLAGVAEDALDLIQERLEDPEARQKIPLTTAIEITKMGADRVGAGPTSTTTNVNIHVGLASKLEEARRRAREASNVLEVRPEARGVA